MEYNKILLPSKTKKIKDDGREGVFEIEGLFPGYGHTLGNVLRRVFLSSIPGTAVTKITFDSQLHEFTTADGVRDDMFTIVMNLKKIHASMPKDVVESIGVLKKDSVGVITAGDIVFSNGVEVSDKSLYITEITKKNTSFNFEILLERGYGFLEQKDISAKDKMNYKIVYPDAYFSPVHIVKYKVSDMRIGHRSDFNRLEIEIETDGTTTPTQCFVAGIETLRTQLEAINNFQEHLAEKKAPGEKAPSSVLISDLEITNSIRKALIEADIKTLEDLQHMKEDDIKNIPKIGDKAVEAIKKAVADYGSTILQ